VPSMPHFGLIGDSSLYCKSSSRRVKRIGCQLQEELATNDLWYHAVANAGVEKILQMLADTRLKFGTLGISYFGNDIMYGKIRPQVRAAWKDLIDLVEEKADRVVFVVGGSSKKYAKHWKLTSQYDDNLAQVRSCIRQRHAVHDLDRQLQRWPLSPDGMHWASEVQEELCATWAELLTPPRWSRRNHSPSKRRRDDGARNEHQPLAWTSDSRSAGVARDHNGTAWNSRRGWCDYEHGSSNGYWPDDGRQNWRDGDSYSYDSSCKRRKVDDARNEHQPLAWTWDSRSGGVARDHNGSVWNGRRGWCDYEHGSSNGYWPDDGRWYWREGDSDSSMKRRRHDDARAYSTAAKPW